MVKIMTDKLLDRMSWETSSGKILDNDRRYVMLRTDVLMGIFRALPDAQQAKALQAFSDSVEQSGGQSARAYFDSLNHDARQLLDTMASYSAELGWGKWTFAAGESKALELTVKNSPFAEGFGASACPVCHPIAGMLKTVGMLVAGGPVQVEETHCAAQGLPDQCKFHIHPL